MPLGDELSSGMDGQDIIANPPLSGDWSWTWPRTEGRYWFYGWHSTPIKIRKDDNDPPRLMQVVVGKTATGYMYVCDGNFMYRSEGAYGAWKRIDELALPDLGPYAGRRA